MKTITFSVFFSLVLVGFSLIFQPANAAWVNPIVHVEGDVVTLGQIFDPAGEDADRPVLRSPEPGQRMTIDSSTLARIAVAHGIDFTPLIGGDTVIIERLSHSVGSEEISHFIAARLSDEGFGSQVEIAISSHIKPVEVSMGAQGNIEIEEISVDDHTKRFVAQVVVETGRAKPQRFRVAGQIRVMVEVPVVSRRIGRGDVIRQNDIAWREVSDNKLRGNYVTSADDLVGMAAKRNISPNAPIAGTDLAHPIVVDKGKAVQMVYMIPGLTLIAVGKAIEDGSMGDVIRIMNTQSKTIVQATVMAPNTVRVDGADQLALN